LNDVIRGVAMTPQSPAPNLVNATFGKSPVVLDFKGAYATVPAGVYFGTEFSISFWVKTENGNSARLFDFAYDKSNRHRIFILLSANQFSFFFSNNNVYYKNPFYKADLNLSQWTFVTVTYGSQELKYYFNETYVGGGHTDVAWQGLNTTINYFGKDLYDAPLNPNFQIFDFKIYDRVISENTRLFDFYNGTFTVQYMFEN